MRIRVLVTLLVFLLCPLAHAQVEWVVFDPMTIRTTRTEPIQVTVQIALAEQSNVDAVRLDYQSGGQLMFTPQGNGRYVATLPAAKALAGFDASDVNRNFLGYARLLKNGATYASYNLFLSVLDDNTPRVPVTTRANNARQTKRILNLYRPLLTPDNVRAAVQQFYAYFPDEFDFVQVVYTLPYYPSNRYHFAVKNEVSGIGLPPLNNTAQYGSAGHLLGITVFPIDTYFDCAESAFSHETGHQWINFLDNARLQPGPHWPPSTMARGLMGFNIPGTNIGGDFPYTITPIGNNQVRVTNGSVTKEFSDFDLYVMGLLPASEVQNGLILDGTLCNNCTMNATTISVNDLIAVHGPRLPSSTTSQKHFRIGTVVISRDRLLNDDELALLEAFAKRGEAKSELPFTAGLASGITKPWYLATRGLSTVDLRLTGTSSKRRSAGH